MANSTLANLPAAAALDGTELYYGTQAGGDVKIAGSQIKTEVSASPTLVTPVIGVATGTSLALGGATIGANALAVTGTVLITGAVIGTANIDIGTNGNFFNSLVRLGSTQGNQFNHNIRFSTASFVDEVIVTNQGSGLLQFGLSNSGNDGAAPTAITLQAQSVVAGTAATSGVDFTIQGSRPTGANAGGAIVFNTAPAGGSGTAQTAAAEVLRLLAAGNVKFTNAANFSANGAVATSITSIGPTGAQTTVQEWLTIQNASGTTRYIPCF